MTITYAISGFGITPIIEVRETDVLVGPTVSNGQASANGRAFVTRDVAAGASAALTIFVKNTGTATMNLGLPALGGANPGDFVLNTTGYSASVLAGASTSFTVAFDPTTTGARAASISFTHDATFTPTASPFTFALSGTGYLPVLTVVAGGTPGETGPTAGTYTITATPAPQIARTVSFTMSGVAQTGVGLDYDLATTLTYGGVSGTFTLGLSGTAVITLTPVNDSRVEATESATFTLTGDPSYTLGAPLAGTLNITDNDSATVTVAAAGAPAEGGGTATYTITTVATLEVALTVNFTISGLASTVTGTDYTLSGAAYAGPTGTATLAIGVGSSTVITLTVANDLLVEGPEDAVLTLNAGTQYVVGVPASATRNITDNDSTTITMVAAGAPNEAGVVTGTYTITATPQPVYATSVNLSLSGTAQFGAGFDYAVSGGGIVISTAPGGLGPWVGTLIVPGGGGASVNVVITLTPTDDTRVEATETAALAITADTLLTDPAYAGTPSQSRSILDNDSATVTVTAAGLPAESPLAAGTYTIATTATLEVALTINFTMSGTAAFAVGGDYNLSGNASYNGGTGAGTATLPVGASPSVIVTLTPVNDTVVEATEFATLTLNAGTQYAPGAPVAGTVLITDDDNAIVTVAFAGSPSETGPTAGTYTISTTSTLEVAVTVNFTMSGAASTVIGADYTLSGAAYAGPTGTATLSIGTGPRSVVVTLTPNNDTIVESNESATLTLTAGTKYSLGAPASGSLTISDNDTATLSVIAAGAPAEGGATATYTITTASTLEIALSVNFTMSGAASSTPGSDYTLNSTTFVGPAGTATLPIGVTPSVIVTLTTVNDLLVEGPEDAIFTLNGGPQYVVGAPANATRTIADNDSSIITMTQSGTPGETGPALGTYTITATPQPAYAMSVNVSLSGVAQFGAAFDYTVSGAGIVISTAPGGAGPWLGTLSMPGGAGASVSVVVTLTPNDDVRVEATESAQLAVTADTLNTDPAYSGAPAQTHNIADNDVATVTVSTSGVPTEAGATAATFTLTTLDILDVPVTVTFSMSGAATVTPANDYGISSAGGSYTGPGGTAILPAGSGSSIVVTLTPVQDSRVEADETAVLTVQSIGQATPGAPGSGTLTITDDDVAVITVTPAGSPAESPLVAGTYTISTASTLEIALTVNFAMSGTAVGADYTLAGAAGFAFPNGTASLSIGAGPRSVVVTFTPVDDALVEGSETATLSVTAGVKYSGTPSANLTILDDDLATVTVTASGTPAEGSVSVSTFTIATTANLAVPLVVNFNMSGLASAVQGTDYTLAGFASYAGPAGTATLPAGLASSVNVTFTVIDDGFVEGPEGVVLTLNAGGYTIGAPASASLTIADNDTSAISITLGGVPAETGASTGTYTLTATPAPVRDMLVNFAMTGTASFAVGGDYTLSGATLSFSQVTGLGSVTIGVGGSLIVTLTPDDDTRVEASETAIMTVTADVTASDPAYSGTPSQIHSIADNDTATVTVTSTGTPGEPATTGSYTLTTTATLETPVIVNFTMSGTASTAAGDDYNLNSTSFAGPSGTATLGVGAGSSVVVVLTPVNDLRVEATESATLTVTTGGQAVAGAPASASLNIADDDTATVTVTSAGAPGEPSTTGSYTITTTDTLETPVIVNFTMSGAASAIAGTDYNLNSTTFTGPAGTATLAAGTGSSVIITLTPVNDSRVEATESATLTVVTGGQATAGAPAFASLNIADDDVATVTVTAAGPAAEPTTTGSYTISTTAILDVALTINFNMSGSASSAPGTDYNLNSATFPGPAGTATLPIGSGSSVVVTLTPVNDAIVEASEIATLTLNAGTQYVPGVPLAGSVVIGDDDSATLTVTPAGSPNETGPLAATFTITTSSTLDVALTVNFTMSGVAATVIGADYNLGGTASYVGGMGAGTFTLPAGAAPSTVITLTPVDDPRIESNEGATFTLNAGTQYTLGAPAAGTLTILDNDNATVSVVAAGSPAETGPASGTYTVSTTDTLEVALTVNFTMSGTASTVSGTDYTLSGAAYTGPGGTCTLPIGAGSNVVVTLTPIDDVAVETTETAVFTLNAGTQYAVGAPASDTLSIFDNDGANVTVTSSGSPSEAGAVSGTFTISTSATLGAPVTVNFSMSGGASAIPGVDYTLGGASYAGPRRHGDLAGRRRTQRERDLDPQQRHAC